MTVKSMPQGPMPLANITCPQEARSGEYKCMNLLRGSASPR